jgi:TatD DNase family protein
MTFIDSHCHLETYVRAGTLEDELARAAAADVSFLISVGTEPEDWAIYRELAARFPGQIAHTAGLHPCSVTPDGWETAVAGLEACFDESRPRPVALGEIGLDYFHLPKDSVKAEALKSAQHAALRVQLALVRKLDVPVVIHSRNAFADCVAEIDASGVDWRRVVFHCFSEGAAEMREVNRRGGRGSFTGVLTYPNAKNVREAALEQGLARFMLETDSPYLAPQPVRGKPNSPANLRYTAEFAAELFGISLEELAGVASANTREFYLKSGGAPG